MSYRSQGTAWLARVQPYQLGSHQFWVATLAPEADFAPNWLAMLGVLCTGLVLTLALVALFAQQQARRIARPLEALAEASERIGNLDFQAEAPEPSNIKEIRQLAVSHDKMRALLQDNQCRLAKQEDELREQIAAPARRRGQDPSERSAFPDALGERFRRRLAHEPRQPPDLRQPGRRAGCAASGPMRSSDSMCSNR